MQLTKAFVNDHFVCIDTHAVSYGEGSDTTSRVQNVWIRGEMERSLCFFFGIVG